VRVGHLEPFAKRQAAKACAHDDNMKFPVPFHADNVKQSAQNATRLVSMGRVRKYLVADRNNQIYVRERV
jgi:hypothetical protein